MSRPARFDGRAVLVTGAAQGMGRAIAEAFIAEGAGVALFDLNGETLARTAGELGERGEALAVRGDASERADVRAAVDACVERFGRLDVAVAHAGIGDLRPFLDIGDDAWDRMLRVNLNGVFYTLQESARAMVAGGRPGAIVVTSSTNAFYPEQHTVHYSTAKGGATALARAASLDLAPQGIRVNSISPGIIRTPLAAPLVDAPEVAGAFLQRVPLGRFGEADEVASVVLFLASDEAAYVTGENIVIDGGTTVGMSLGVDEISLPGFDDAPPTTE